MSHADVFAVLMERADAAGLAEWRAKLVRDVKGRVLEIGCGTGSMFRYYAEGVTVIGTEPAEDFLELAKKAAADCAASVTTRVAHAEQLPFEDESFDVVVVASVLCAVKSVDGTLAEIRRVLKPGGEVRLIEHVRSERAIPGLLMDIFNPLWRIWNRIGCNMNRRTDAKLRAAGFDLVEVVPFQTFAPGLPAFPTLWIRAVPGPTPLR
ncbi:MAG: class I SAM-dependent methyltransferase [Planctomycetota bacterium]|jgi:SAM-dependent methyltransferase